MKNKFKIILGVALLSGVVLAASITKFYGDIDMQSHRITYLGTPTANADATTKTYVDTAISASALTRLPLSGGTMSGAINMGGKKITNLATPTATTDTSTKGYVDDEITATQDLIDTAALNASNLATRVSINATNYTDRAARYATNLATRVSVGATNYVNTTKATLDTSITNLWKGVYKRLKLSGGTMTGDISMGSHKISNLPEPTSNADAATKAYADTKLSSSGGTMTGDINMNGHAIHNLRTPIGDNDAATRGYVNSVINNATAYQYFALRKGSSYPPMFNMNHHHVTNFTIVVLRQFTGSITSYYENIRAVATPNFANKTWKVGDTLQVGFSLLPETFVETNGTLVVKGPSGVLGNFGITTTPNGTSPFTCDLIVNGTTYAPNTSLSLNTIWDNVNKCFTFKLKNTSGRTISNAVITAPAVVQYVSPTPYTSTHLYFVDPGTYLVVPGTLTISSWANNMELTFRLYVIDIDNDYGFRWNFNISADGQSYDYGQFFYYIP